MKSPLPLDAPSRATSVEPRAGGGFKNIFSFNGKDGRSPYASLVYVNGALVGTTYGGGSAKDGTVYRITPSGKQMVLHSFRGGVDGALPESSVLNVSGTLYGTTVNGGGPGDEGIVFALPASGGERILHRFTGGSDGANPYAGLVQFNGALYGTTATGGKHSGGTVFEISPSGDEQIVYNFGSTGTDGTTPVARLLNVGGTLYGTTSYGGGHCGSFGCGTVFKLTASGTETVVYAFKGGKDGALPLTPLIDMNGTLYGATSQGGGQNAGTVFEITASGSEQVIYSFNGGADGAVPQELTAMNGTLYGTTASGGSKNVGTVFSLTPAGKKSVLYEFTGGSDGARPHAGLHDLKGVLYGTTAEGGTAKDGTVFSISE
jgi:uncharacterized repeat protein (TIGR03803 family)